MKKNTTTYSLWYNRNFGQSVPTNMEKDEKKFLKHCFDLFQALERNDNESLWGVAIQKVVDDGGKVHKMMALVAQLRSQATDNATLMRNILGADYGAILNTPIIPWSSWKKVGEK